MSKLIAVKLQDHLSNIIAVKLQNIQATLLWSNFEKYSGNFVANNNGFYVVSKRAIGDFLAENVNGVTNPTAGSSGYEGPRRGVGVFNSPGGQFVTDRWS